MKCRICKQLFNKEVSFSTLFMREEEICKKCKKELIYNLEIESFPISKYMGHYLSVFINQDKMDTELEDLFLFEFGDLIDSIIKNISKPIVILSKSDMFNITYDDLCVIAKLNQSDIYLVSIFRIDLTKYFKD